MTKLSPSALASKVAKESTGVSVKVGQCNGDPVLHLNRRANPGAGRPFAESRTIPASEVEWNVHPWNDANPYGAKDLA